MDIRKYIADCERTYHYRVKAALPLDDEIMSRIEGTVMKYQPVNVAAPKKTIFQKNPLDFPNVQNAEIYYFDMELGLPAGVDQLRVEITKALGAPESFIIVRGDNDPVEREAERLTANKEMDEQADKQGLEPGALLTVNDYAEAPAAPAADELYGTAYNSKLLAYLKKIEDERTEMMKVEPQHALFSWMDLPKPEAQADNFNDGIADAPKAATTTAEELPAKTSIQRNLDDEKREFRRAYQDKKGSPKVLSNKGNPVRKD